MMRYKITFLLLLIAGVAFARPQKRGVVVDTVCNASLETMLRAAERFCTQFQMQSDSLAKWAYVGISEKEKEGSSDKPTKESRNAIRLDYKERVYDPVLKTGDVAIDIYVLGVRWWKDQHLGTKYMVIKPTNEPEAKTAKLIATYSGSILEGGEVIFSLHPINATHTRVRYEFNLTFGRVLSAFISDKTWKNAVEWRFRMIIRNIIEFAETGTVKPQD